MAAGRPVIVGAFVLGGLALAVAAILFFGGGRLFERKIHAVVFFEGSVAGLEVGAPVTFRGVRVGSVERMALHLSADGTSRVPVYLELLPGQIVRIDDGPEGEPEFEHLVDVGLRAQLSIQSLVTGQLRVDLDFRPDTPANMVDVDTGGIPQIPSVASDLERLRSTLADVPVQEVAQTVLRSLATVQRLAEKLDAGLTPLLKASRQTVESATRTLDTTQQAVATLETEASRMLRQLSELAEEARQQIDNRGAELERVLATADRVARQAESVLASLNDLTDPRSRFRSDLAATARDLAASAASLRGFASTIERNPSAVLRGRSAR